MIKKSSYTDVAEIIKTIKKIQEFMVKNGIKVR